MALTTVLSNLRPFAEMNPGERLWLYEAVDAVARHLNLTASEKCIVTAGMTWWTKGKSFDDGMDVALISELNIAGDAIQ